MKFVAVSNQDGDKAGGQGQSGKHTTRWDDALKSPAKWQDIKFKANNSVVGILSPDPSRASSLYNVPICKERDSSPYSHWSDEKWEIYLQLLGKILKAELTLVF